MNAAFPEAMNEDPRLKATGQPLPELVEMDRFPFKSSTPPLPNVNVLFALFVKENDVPAGMVTWLYAVKVLFVIATVPTNSAVPPSSVKAESTAATAPVSAMSVPAVSVNAPPSKTIVLPGAEEKDEPQFKAREESVRASEPLPPTLIAPPSKTETVAPSNARGARIESVLRLDELRMTRSPDAALSATDTTMGESTSSVIHAVFPAAGTPSDQFPATFQSPDVPAVQVVAVGT